MLSYVSGTSDKPMLGETIDANLRRAVASFADREAVVDVATERRCSYRELD
jgi:fatty-acyl-CoA synthase